METDTSPALARLEALRNESLTSVLEAEIQRMILNGEISQGERLNESTLAQNFNISRGPVREACRALATKGLIEMKPNRGFFVRRLSRKEAEDIYEVRAALFGCAARLFAMRITAADQECLQSLVGRMSEAAASGDIDVYYPANLEFHGIIVDESGNQTLARTYRGLVESLHVFRARGLVHERNMEPSNREHQAIVEALLARDPDMAFRAAFDHVDAAKSRMAKAGCCGDSRPVS